MASDGKDFKQDITADPTNFLDGWKKAVAGASAGADAMKSSIGKIGEAFSAIQKPLLVISAIFAGGAFFKDAIKEANKLNGESMSLAKALGITGTQASALNTALGDIGSDSETYIGAFQKFAKQLKTNEAGLQSMGLRTRDANGHLRDSDTLFTEAVQTVGTYKAGLDQTTAAQTLFGKGVNEVMGLQKLNNKVLEEAKQKNEELGLTVTKEGIEGSKKYKMAMNDVEDVFVAIKNVIGQAVMPIFTELANWFSEIGPTAVFVFKVSIDVVATLLRSFVGLVHAVGDVVRGLLNPLFEVGAAFKKLIQGDVSGATAQMQGAFSGWRTAIGEGFDKAGEDLKRTASDVSNLWKKGTEVAAPGKGTKTMGDFGHTNGGPKTDPSRMGEWEAKLAQDKAGLERQGMLEGQFREMSKAAEQKYWDELKGRKDLSDAERIALARKAADMEMATIKGTFEQKIAVLQTEAAAYKNNTAERLRIELEIQAKFQQGTKQYEESAKRIVEIQRQAADQERTIKASRIQADRDFRLQGIALEEQGMQTAAQLGLLNQAQVLAAQATFENRRNAIALEAITEREQIALMDPDKNIVEIEKINTEKEALERAHQLRMGQIREQSVLESQKVTQGVINAMGQGFQNVFAQAMQGQLSLKGVMQGLWTSMTTALTNALAKMAADWAIAKMTQLIMGKASAASEIAANAGVAGAAAVASTAAIPIVGPAMAPAAGAAAFAAAMAFAPMASAAGGFDIPGNLNPIVQTHAREMILPAKHADVIRSMADQGQGGGGAGGGDTHLHVHTQSTQDFANFLSKNSHVLAPAIRRLGRNFSPSNA